MTTCNKFDHMSQLTSVAHHLWWWTFRQHNIQIISYNSCSLSPWLTDSDLDQEWGDWGEWVGPGTTWWWHHPPMCTLAHHLLYHCTSCTLAQHTGSPCHMSRRDDCEISPTKHPYQLALTESRKSLFTGHRWWDDDRHLIDPHLQPVLLMQKPFSGYYFRIICGAQPT